MRRDYSKRNNVISSSTEKEAEEKPIVNTSVFSYKEDKVKKNDTPKKANVTVNISRLTLRKNKSTSSELVTTYAKDTVLVKDNNSSDKEWSKIVSPDVGYVRSEYII